MRLLLFVEFVNLLLMLVLVGDRFNGLFSRVGEVVLLQGIWVRVKGFEGRSFCGIESLVFFFWSFCLRIFL